MDSIFNDDNKNGDDEKKKGDEGKGLQDEEVTVARYNELKMDIDEERKKRLAELLPDEAFKTPKTSGQRPLWSNCFFMFSIGFLIVTLAAVLWGLQYFGKDLVTSTPTAHVPVVLSIREKADLDRKLEKYREALEKSGREKDSEEFEIKLTGSQLNYLLEQFENSIPGDRKIYVRAYPDGNQVDFYFSFPFEKKGFMNVNLIGKPEIQAYQLNMDIYAIQIGSMKNATGMKKKTIDKINRELDQYPRVHGLPFRIYSMKVDTSVFHITLSLKPNTAQEN
jgi:hypothetical protein